MKLISERKRSLTCFMITCCLAVFASRLVSLAVPSAMSSQHPAFVHSSRSAAKKMKSAKVVCENYKDVDRKSDHLSSTLEKLHVWEKKLYEEVKVWHLNSL